MRICHIGHGRLPIPPTAYGAVEAIISDYQFHCEKLGHEFLAVNDLSPCGAMMRSESFQSDIAHLHDESKIDAFAVLAAPIKIVTTHDPTFFEKPNPFIKRFIEGDFLIGCLSDEQIIRFLNLDVPNNRVLLFQNGARSDLIRFQESARFPDRMVCLGNIGARKRQHFLLGIPFVDCIGPVSTYDPIVTTKVTFESWTKGQVYRNLTDYSALVLLSKSEAAPLVVMEALMAGLDAVVSEAASANLDVNQPFVHVLSESTITNPTLLRIALANILKAPKDREAVRRYAEQNLDWSVLVQRYLETLQPLLSSCAAAPHQ